jgi:hypothetical protein
MEMLSLLLFIVVAGLLLWLPSYLILCVYRKLFCYPACSPTLPESVLVKSLNALADYSSLPVHSTGYLFT